MSTFIKLPNRQLNNDEFVYMGDFISDNEFEILYGLNVKLVKGYAGEFDYEILKL